MKKVKISTPELKGIIKESLIRILNEGYSDGAEEIQSMIRRVAYNLQMYADEVKMFEKEFEEFTERLNAVVEKMGLIPDGVDTDYDDFEENPKNGFSIGYEYRVGNYDVMSLDDDSLDRHIQKVESIIDDVKMELGSYDSCDVKVGFSSSDGVEVTCRFYLWI